MLNILIQLSKYLLIILAILYTFQCFTVFKRRSDAKKNKVLRKQFTLILLIVSVGYLDIFLCTKNYFVIVLYAGIILYFVFLQLLYRLFYPKASMLVINNMCMLLGIGFIMLARLQVGFAMRQFVIAAIASLFAFLIPVIIRKLTFLSKLRWIYAVIGIIFLGIVLVLAQTSGGAKLSIEVAGVTFQLSEIVKISFVFFMASSLYKDQSFKNIIITTAVAALHVVILVLSTDLGTGLVFFVTYLVLIFVSTKKVSYSLAGLSGGCVAAVGAYFVFDHVKKRVVYWKDPFSDYSHAYQVVQGMFAIGAGGWFGTGLCQGSPNIIPLATTDFIFTAISEEFGNVFCICLILICMSLFLMVVNISMKIRNPFYKMIALGLGTEYAFQVFLNIGGSSKFIPLTGITLPLVSYGGSSVMSTILMLAIVQGLYILREDEDEKFEKARRKTEQERKEKKEWEKNELKRQERAIIEAGGIADLYEDTRKR